MGEFKKGVDFDLEVLYNYIRKRKSRYYQYPLFPKRHPTLKVVGRQFYLVGFKPTKLDRFSFALGSGLFHYDRLHFIIKAMYHISSRNCLIA